MLKSNNMHYAVIKYYLQRTLASVWTQTPVIITHWEWPGTLGQCVVRLTVNSGGTRSTSHMHCEYALSYTHTTHNILSISDNLASMSSITYFNSLCLNCYNENCQSVYTLTLLYSTLSLSVSPIPHFVHSLCQS